MNQQNFSLLGLCVMIATIASTAFAKDVVLMTDGKPACTLVVADAIMADDDINAARTSSPTREAEMNRRRLRESVRDLARYLATMSGAAEEPRIVAPEAAGDAVYPVRIGPIAETAYGPVGKEAPYRQAFRTVVREDGMGLYGESDLATSYAIYTLLDELGCRWYMPGPHGAVIPARPTVSLSLRDTTAAPYTHYRGISVADGDYIRRNRLGGFNLHAAHALEYYISQDDRKAHPEWVATVGGKPSRSRLKWSADGLDEAIAAAIVRRLEKRPNLTSVSLSPADGLGFDDSAEDQALDTGDYDPTVQSVSITDRLVWLSNRIVARVEPTHPDIYYGMLAYVNYTRPPTRETLHPRIVPQIAPITYSRAHPMTDPGEPNNEQLRALISGWGDAAAMTSIYYYGWFLAEPSAPNPYITKWSTNIPIAYEQGACRFWQPETTCNFETTTQALYLGIRMAWDPTQEPATIIDRFHRDFYGAAAPEMTAYWTYIDRIWVDTPEYSGCGFGYLHRFTPERMKEARRLLDTGRNAARTPAEQYRIELVHESLRQFELFMSLREDLAAGRFAGLDIRAAEWQTQLLILCDRYSENYCFGRLRGNEPKSLYGRYFGEFYQHTYDDAARLAREAEMLTPTLRTWQFQADPEAVGPLGELPAEGWRETDVAVDTWSALGLHNYMGGAWYRRQVSLPESATTGGPVYLWIGATDGSVRVTVNGTHVPYLTPKGETRETASGYCRPFSFDISSAIKPGANDIVIYATRTTLNELGTGGLLAAPIIYRVPEAPEIP